MTKEQKIEAAIAGLGAWDRVVRKSATSSARNRRHCGMRKSATEVEWIAFKLGCSDAEAKPIVKLARERMAATTLRMHGHSATPKF